MLGPCTSQGDRDATFHRVEAAPQQKPCQPGQWATHDGEQVQSGDVAMILIQAVAAWPLASQRSVQAMQEAYNRVVLS